MIWLTPAALDASEIRRSDEIRWSDEILENDPKDRHEAASAIAGGRAQAIVTLNVADFGGRALPGALVRIGPAGQRPK